MKEIKWKLLVCTNLEVETLKKQRVEEITYLLEENYGINYVQVNNLKNLKSMLMNDKEVAAIFIEIDEFAEEFQEISQDIKKISKKLPLIGFSQIRNMKELNYHEYEELDDFYYLYSDTAKFLAGRIHEHIINFLKIITPPFLKEVIKYSEEYKYAWHTPGHMGGVAFTKSPSGNIFHEFLGENVFRTDLSISVPDLGSLLDHTGPIGESEKYASKVFGSDATYYVLNGTSSVNQIIWRGNVTEGDSVVVDRNCHKSLNYGIVISKAEPNYLIPRRNAIGIIGPVRLEEFSEVPNSVGKPIEMLALTNSTYDGICYNTEKILKNLSPTVKNIHFDEAWYAYAKFHPIYNKFYGMNATTEKINHPPIFVSQSTHKLLAALSQASMLHVKNGTTEKVNEKIFNEAFMMYTSTSPQYTMIASLDVATSMMEHDGENLMAQTILDAVELRKDIAYIKNQMEAKGEWFFEPWQPRKVNYNGEIINFEDVPTDKLIDNQKYWILTEKDNWHGFDKIEEDFIMLDPIKVTIKTPGISVTGEVSEEGIPAAIISNYLLDFGVVTEKTDYYSMLFLNSIGTTKGKQGELVIGLSHFKRLYDENTLLDEVFPELVGNYPETYKGVGLKDHCTMMHKYIVENKMLEMMDKAYETLPNAKYTPSEAAKNVFKRKVKEIAVHDLKDETIAVMIVPYPPGIPILMGGEVVDEKSKSVIDYLIMREKFEQIFPGYYGDIHGIEAEYKDGKRIFTTMIIDE